MGWLQNKLRDLGSTSQDAPQPEAPTPSHIVDGLYRFDPAVTDDYVIAWRDDPDLFLRMLRTADGAKAGRDVPLGMATQGSWVYTFPDNHLLAIAPPRSTAGKTSSVIVPAILSHLNPVVTASTKTDVMTATAMARAQYGQLWCYAPDGDTDHIPEGVNELRWSPLMGAREWDTAIATAYAMTMILDTNSVRGGDHWKERAADLLAPVLHWAALTKASMRDVRDSVYDRSGLDSVADALEDLGAGQAAGMLRSVTEGAREESASIASSAARALNGYRTDAALRSAEKPNFSISDFVNGGFYGVRADTVYITASSDKQSLVAPLVVAFLTQIQRTVYYRHRALAKADLDGGPGSGPILFALDELYGLAPLPDLPHMLSEGASHGLLIVAAIQDLSLIKSRWPKEAGAFMTMFGHVLVFPGIRDVDTLEAVSKLHGSYDHEKRERSVKRQQTGGGFFAAEPGGWEDQEEGARLVSERRLRLDPNEVMLGPDPDNPDVLIHFGPPGVGQIIATPYHRAAPWPMVLTAYLERAISGLVPEWRYWESEYSRGRPDLPDTLAGLPVPRLDAWVRATTGGLEAHECDRSWAQRYEAALARRAEILDSAPRPQQWDLRPGIFPGMMWVTTHVGVRSGVPPTDEERAAAIKLDEDDSRQLASGEWASPHELDLPEPEFVPKEHRYDAQRWQEAREAAAKDPADRTASDTLTIVWANTVRDASLPGTLAWLYNVREAEKNRREAAGDHESVSRFFEALEQGSRVAEEPGTPEYRERQEQRQRIAEEAQRRGHEPSSTLWTDLPADTRQRIEAFVLRRDLTPAADAAADERLIRLARGFETINAELADWLGGGMENRQPGLRHSAGDRRTPSGGRETYAQGPTPQAHRTGDPIPPVRPPATRPSKWEPDWGPDEDTTMRRWRSTGPMPDCFQSNYQHMWEAIGRERQRRRELGDGFSVERYDSESRRILDEAREDPPAGVDLTRKKLGFWAFLPPGLEDLTKAFLRGD